MTFQAMIRQDRPDVAVEIDGARCLVRDNDLRLCPGSRKEAFEQNEPAKEKPDAQPAQRRSRTLVPERSPCCRPVPANTQWSAATTSYGAAVIAPASEKTTPSRLASDST